MDKISKILRTIKDEYEKIGEYPEYESIADDEFSDIVIYYISQYGLKKSQELIEEIISSCSSYNHLETSQSEAKDGHKYIENLTSIGNFLYTLKYDNWSDFYQIALDIQENFIMYAVELEYEDYGHQEYCEFDPAQREYLSAQDTIKYAINEILPYSDKLPKEIKDIHKLCTKKFYPKIKKIIFRDKELEVNELQYIIERCLIDNHKEIMTNSNRYKIPFNIVIVFTDKDNILEFAMDFHNFTLDTIHYIIYNTCYSEESHCFENYCSDEFPCMINMKLFENIFNDIKKDKSTIEDYFHLDKKDSNLSKNIICAYYHYKYFESELAQDYAIKYMAEYLKFD